MIVSMMLKNLMKIWRVITVYQASSSAGLTSGNLTLETLALSGSSRSLPTQDWNSGRRDSASSAGSMRYTNSNAFLKRNGPNVRQDDAITSKQCLPEPLASNYGFRSA